MRLVDGVTQNEGRVEICIEQKWGSVYICDSLLHSAEIICRELGSKSKKMAERNQIIIFFIQMEFLFLDLMED